MEEKEIPLGVPGYTVGSSGSIYSYTGWRGGGKRRLAQHADNDGYLRVRIKCKGKTISRKVHRIVCEAFHGCKANRLHQIRHLDGNKLNNSAENLSWGTAKENAHDRDMHGRTASGSRNGMSVLSDDEVIAIRIMYNKGMSPSTLAAFLGTTKETIIKCAKGRSYVKR